MIKYITILIMGLFMTQLFAQDIADGCDLPDNNLYITSSGSILYNSTDDIGGFQFAVDGNVTSASGGDAELYDFDISYSNTVVLAFSFTGSFIPCPPR